MDIEYKAVPTASRLHKDPNTFLFVRGPVGSGKSSMCIMHCFLNALCQAPYPDGVRRTRYVVIRSTYPALKTTVVKSWMDWFQDNIKVVYDIPIRALITLDHPDGITKIEMEIYFVALDRPEEVSKLQSFELTGAHINEATDTPREIFNMLKTRIGRFPPKKIVPVTKKFIVLDYNSPDTEHWLYTIAEEDRPKKHSFYVQPPAMLFDGLDKDGIRKYKTNPEAENLENLADDYYEDMVLGNDDDFINVYVLNNYGMVRHGRPVYREYIDSIHASQKVFGPLRGVPIVIGMDCGLNPSAAFCQLSPIGTFQVFHEIATDDCSIIKFCEDYLWPVLRNEFSGFNYQIVVDPAAIIRSETDLKSAADILRTQGLYFRTAKTNNPLARREAVIYFLRRTNGFLLSPSCTFLRKGFISEYKYESVRSAQTSRFKDKPEKNLYSHPHDALQYAALELRGGRILRPKYIPDSKFTQPATSAGY